MERIVTGMGISEVLKNLRGNDGYYITNTARDLSQSDFKNRILLHTDLLAAPSREKANFFSLEMTGGASVHVDILRKQVDPFLKLELLREKMPITMFQTLCRGVNLFGYRHYPQNVIRLTVREFAKYIDVWRVFDFMNHIPNMQAVFEDFAEQPELLIDHPGLARDVVGSILKALASAESPRLETVASAGVQAVLSALAKDPDLIGTRYPGIIAEVAGSLAKSLEDLRLTRDETGDILVNVATTIAADPMLVGIDQDSLSANVLAAVFKELAEHRGDLLTSTAIREVVGAVLEVVSVDPGLLADKPELVRAAVAPILKELSGAVSGSGS